jgi:hypothetical protein
MGRLSRPVLVAALAAFVVTLVPTGAFAELAHKPLPKDGCDLVDQKKLDAVLGVSTGPPTAEPVGQGGVGCLVPTPFDSSTCNSPYQPGIRVGAIARKGQASLKEGLEAAEQAGYDVKQLKGKAYGRKGGFLLVTDSATGFFGDKGAYRLQVEARAACDPIPNAAAAVEAAAKTLVQKV